MPSHLQVILLAFGLILMLKPDKAAYSAYFAVQYTSKLSCRSAKKIIKITARPLWPLLFKVEFQSRQNLGLLRFGDVEIWGRRDLESSRFGIVKIRGR